MHMSKQMSQFSEPQRSVSFGGEWFLHSITSVVNISVPRPTVGMLRSWVSGHANLSGCPMQTMRSQSLSWVRTVGRKILPFPKNPSGQRSCSKCTKITNFTALLKILIEQMYPFWFNWWLLSGLIQRGTYKQVEPCRQTSFPASAESFPDQCKRSR